MMFDGLISDYQIRELETDRSIGVREQEPRQQLPICPLTVGRTRMGEVYRIRHQFWRDTIRSIARVMRDRSESDPSKGAAMVPTPEEYRLQVTAARARVLEAAPALMRGWIEYDV